MPIARLISQGAFAPEEVQVVTEAYELVIARLDLKDELFQARAAKLVVDLAENSAPLSAEELAQTAIARLQN